MIMILKLNLNDDVYVNFHYIEMAAPFKVYGCLKLTQGVQDF